MGNIMYTRGGWSFDRKEVIKLLSQFYENTQLSKDITDICDREELRGFEIAALQDHAEHLRSLSDADVTDRLNAISDNDWRMMMAYKLGYDCGESDKRNGVRSWLIAHGYGHVWEEMCEGREQSENRE